MLTISDILKEFEEKFNKKMLNTKGEAPDVFCWRTGYNARMAENWEENKELKSFITQSLRELLEQVGIGEDILICEKHSSNNSDTCDVCKIGKKCSNACRQQVEEKIKEILNT